MQEPAQTISKKLSDEDLVRLCADKPYDSPEWEDLSKRCLAKMETVFRTYVFGRNFYPRGVDRDDFVNDCVSKMMEKFLTVLRTSPPRNLSALIWTAAKRMIIDEYRKHIPPGPGTETDFETLVRTHSSDDEETPATGGPSYEEVRFRKDPTLFVEERERQEMINTLLTIHGATGSKRDKDCCLWIRESLNGTDVTEIAKRRGTTKDDVWHLFTHDYKSLHEICKERFPTLQLKDIGI